MEKGRLISFEGLDGAGKSTQISMLTRWLESQHVPFLQTREPGGTPLGNEIRQLVLHRPDLTIVPLAEAFLFQADRAQHFATLVIPALQEGKLVLTDRCFDASIVYQGFARGLDVALIENLSLLATEGYKPDLTILLDLDPSQVSRRTDTAQDLTGMREQRTRFDDEVETFHQHVRTGFLTLARAHPERIKVINAGKKPEEIHQEIVKLVSSLL